ncbi:tetratricopeptide repeat protein [Prevotella sp. 10(H)]|uniref:tetratricopeptide repeat protein n=1 Tax=Prevotella sp. 10(H) TaxID=1158294 RepID=UPI0004A6D5F0|nr:tetratricopeptide repeat protein [Prevotella sp. 10(H)]
MKKILLFLLLIYPVLNTTAQTYEEMVNRAMDYVDQNDYPAAEQAMKAALRKEPTNPNNPMLMVNLGTIQRNLGNLDEALISYNVAIENYPDAIFIRHNRAALYCEMNRFDDALKDYNTILLAEPKDLEALYRRALIYVTNKDYFTAEDDFEKILETYPEHLNAKMGIAAIKKRRLEWKEAEEMYSDLIYKHRTNPNAALYYNRAECYLRMNKLSSTDTDIKKALELGYDDASIYILRGQLRLAQYEKRLAKEDFVKAKELGAEESIVEEFLRLCK